MMQLNPRTNFKRRLRLTIVIALGLLVVLTWRVYISLYFVKQPVDSGPKINAVDQSVALYQKKINFKQPVDSGPKINAVDQFVALYQKKINYLNSTNMLTATTNHRYCANNEKGNVVCIEPNCTGLPPLPMINRESVEGIRVPALRVGEDRLRAIPGQFNVKGDKKKYIFLMALSSNHFIESQAAFKGLHQVVFPHLSNYSLVVYDMGLKEHELMMIRKYGRADIRTFPFSSFPGAGHLKCYTWKPLIIMAHIEEAEVIIWVDASLRFLKDIRPLLERVTHTGILVHENGFQFSQHMASTVFDYFSLGERACQFSAYQEIEAGFVIYHNEPFVRHLVLEPWVACAMDLQCMCPDSSRSMLTCRPGRKYGKCHRYDQAVLGYILIKLFRYQRDSILIKNSAMFYNINEYQLIKYFYDLQKSHH